MDRLQDKRAIVTGVGAGIGYAIALRFTEEGAMVTLANVDEDAAGRVADEIDSQTLVYKTDVTRAKGGLVGRLGHQYVLHRCARELERPGHLLCGKGGPHFHTARWPE